MTPATDLKPDLTTLLIRDLRGLEEMHACEALYARVMSLRPEDGSINPRLLIALQHNSGLVLGAFLGPRLVGFTYSFLARDLDGPGPGLYQYSQLTVVAGDAQGQGVGRMLKQAQRDRCRAIGITEIRWAFDPLRARNAHFNLDVLGGTVVHMVPAMYGEHGFGADSGDQTDRFIIQWRLGPEADRRAVAELPAREWSFADVVTDGPDVLVATPASWSRYRSDVGAGAAAMLRDRLRASFAAALDADLVGVSCRAVDAEVAVYRFCPGRGGGRP